MSLMGLDIGTTACKAVAFDDAGKVLAQARRTYRLRIREPGLCELDPREVWRAICCVLSAVHERTRHQNPVHALGISALADCVTAISRSGKFLSPTLLAMDQRAQQECHWLEQQLGRQRYFEITGQPLYPLYPVNKILWWQRHAPKMYAKAWKFLGWQDYVIMQLVGSSFVDFSLASRTGLFDLHKQMWSQELLSVCDIAEPCLPEPMPPGSLVGVTGTTAHKDLGLPAGIAVAVGSIDQNCAALGAGISRAGSAADSLGTVECIIYPFEGVKTTPEMLAGNFSCCPYVCSNLYATYAFNFSAGSLLDWFIRNFAAGDVRRAKQHGLDPFDFVLRKLPRQPARPMVLPHFLGSGTPHLDPNSKGAILGLSMSSGPYEVLRAICEAVNLEMLLNLQHILTAGIPVNELRVTGRGARSNILLQLKADILGLPVHRVSALEGGCYGAAALAGVASGALGSLEDFTSRLMIEKSFVPRDDVAAHYRQRFQIYRGLYEALKETHHRM